MRISIRLNDTEEEKLHKLQDKTGLSVTALVKKGLFDTNENLSKTIIKKLGTISTSVNLAKYAIDRNDENRARYHLTSIEKGVIEIWRSL